MSVPKLFEFRGEMQPVSIIAETVGVSTRAIYDRLRKGMALDAPAIRCGNHKRAPTTYDYNGEQLTCKEISERTGIYERTLRSRLHYGRPLEAPLARNRRSVVELVTSEPDAPLATPTQRRLQDEVPPCFLDPARPFAEDHECKRLIAKYGPMTLEEVGHLFGVTRERVRQIEALALGKLKNRRSDANVQSMIECADELASMRKVHHYDNPSIQGEFYMSAPSVIPSNGKSARRRSA